MNKAPAAQSQLPSIPIFDARDTGLTGYAAARRDAALALRNACFAPAPPALVTPLLNVIDAVSLRWLARSGSPYVEDIESLAHILGFAGVATINMGYQFGCTTGVVPGRSGAPLMRRVLDWPLAGLGRGIEIVRQCGAAGDYINVTWPGAAGVLTATAPGRFCAALNQAPLQRRTQGALLRIADLVRHLRHTLKDAAGWPPDHLLRFAFDTCRNFDDALDLLQREPVARPVLFTLAGTGPGETALIEREGVAARVYRGDFAAANDWQVEQPDWEPRGCGRDKRADNRERCALMLRAMGQNTRDFAWVSAPILNARTRLAVEMDATGALSVRGYERGFCEKIAAPATRIAELSPAACASV